MGVEYRHYLIPRPNSFRPNAEQLAGLVEELATNNWIAAPGSAALRQMAIIDEKSQEEAAHAWARVRLEPGFDSVPYPLRPDWFMARTLGDLKLGFPVDHADKIGIRYPLLSGGDPPRDAYYEIEIHLSRDFVHHVSELIEPGATECECGEPLEYNSDEDVFYASRIRIQCPRCSEIFDPELIPVVVRDGWTGTKSRIDGGAIYRFAVVIDCGKCIPERTIDPIRANRSLVDLVRRVVGHDFYEIGDIY